MAKFFSSENWLWKPFGYLADVVLMSCLFLVCSVPVVPLGGGVCALYDCAARCIRGKDPAIFARFFRTGKREFLPGLLTSLLWGAILAGLFCLIRLLANSLPTGQTFSALTVALLVLFVEAVGIGCWMLPILSRFSMDFWALQQTGLRLALGHPVRTLLLGGTAVGALWLCLRFLLPVFVLPMVVMLIWSWILEPVFAPFMDETPVEDEASAEE